MAKMTKEEAFRAGYQNPIAGDISPLQRLYGTVQAMGEELSGADMGTPVGQRFGQRQAATKAEVKRLQALRAAHPEEFGRGQMVAQDRMDPYMLDLGLGTARAMRPGVTAFSPAEAEGAPSYGGELGYRQRGNVLSPESGPTINAGFDVPRGMNRFEANQYYFTHGIPGDEIYRRSNYGGELGFRPRGRMPSPPGEPIEMGAPYWPNAVPRGMNRFQANTFGMTYRRPGNEMHRYSNMDFVPTVTEGQSAEMAGGVVAPYRQGGLVYEPVGQQAGQRQIGGPGMAQRLGYERGPIEGEFSDVYGIAGPRTGSAMTAGPRPYGGSMDFGVTRDGMAAAPSGMMFDPRVAAGAAGLGYLAGLPGERQTMATAGGASPRGPVQLPPIDVFGPRGASVLSGQAPGAGTAFEAPRSAQRAPAKGKSGAAKSGAKGKSVPLPPRREQEAAAGFEPNFNYLVTAAIDRLLGQREAERGREFQQYYERNPL